MRILILTAGSRGDVAPYTGLGRSLQDAGHQVTVAANDPFAVLIRQCGLEFRSLSGDPQRLVHDAMHAHTNAAKKRVKTTYLQGLGEGVVTAVEQGADLILSALGTAPIAILVAEAFRIPSMGVYLGPAVPTGAFAPPQLAPIHSLGSWGNRAAGRSLLGRGGSLYTDVLAQLRRRLGLPTRGDQVLQRRQGKLGWPICHGFSPAVVPRPADWPPTVEVVGYWWPQPAPDWRPSGDLVDFLAAGSPPVFVGFGSMAPGHGERLGPLITAALRRAAVRGVLQAGWAGLAAAGPDMFAVGELPHEWLCPRMAAVVHHAGAGTTAAGLRAGLPTVAVPVLADQPFWASRLHRLGVGPRPVPFKHLTIERLAKAIKAAVSDPAYRRRATMLARRMSTDNGAGQVASKIDHLEAG